jgi:hypothetical protein
LTFQPFGGTMRHGLRSGCQPSAATFRTLAANAASHSALSSRFPFVGCASDKAFPEEDLGHSPAFTVDALDGKSIKGRHSG